MEKWYNCLLEICLNHKLPAPLDDERLPVGTGSNPVSSHHLHCSIFFIYFFFLLFSILEIVFVLLAHTLQHLQSSSFSVI